jgi:hypothetical protein
VREETPHFTATVLTLGQQRPSSFAASAKAIKMSLDAGGSCCSHAQFIAFTLMAARSGFVNQASDLRDTEIDPSTKLYFCGPEFVGNFVVARQRYT